MPVAPKKVPAPKRPTPKKLHSPNPTGRAPLIAERTPGTLPSVYFDEPSRLFFWKTDAGEFIHLDTGAVTVAMKELGWSDERAGGLNSAVESQLNDWRLRHYVRWSGPLAGHWPGLITANAQTILVTRPPRVIEPGQGNNTEIWNFFRRLLGDQQAQYLFAWLKVGRESFINQTYRRAPAIIMVGEANHGKTMAGWIINKCFGDRQADPTQFAQGTTQFNSHLFGSEFIFSDDKGGGQDDYHAQKATAAALKGLIAEKTPQCHGKHKDPLSFDKIFWRVMYALNDEDEDLKVLPALSEGIMKKLVIFRTIGRAVIEETNTDEQFKAFEAKLLAAIPDFLGQLARWTIPASIKTDEKTVNRFGHDVYHHPGLLHEMQSLGPETSLLQLLDEAGVEYEDKLTAREIEAVLKEHETESIRTAARTLLPRFDSCGRYLSRLARRMPERVTDAGKLHGRTQYTILPPE